MKNRQVIQNNHNFIKNKSLNQNQNQKLDQIIGIESAIPININALKEKIIDNIQYDIITQICVESINNNRKDITLYCTEKIIKKLKGQWFVLIQNITDDNFEFNFSKIKYNNILIFQYKDKIIYVSPI